MPHGRRFCKEPLSRVSASVLASVTTHRELVENLILRDIKTRYKQSVLGYAWAVFNPLLFALIYTLVGKLILKQDARIPFPLFAYYGLLYWNLFATGLANATDSLVFHISLITKVYFPREVLPISAVVSKLFDFAFGLVGMIPLLLAYHIAPAPSTILILPVLLILLLFTAGLGMLCGAANLFYRDVRYLVGLATNILSFLVPNIYPLEQIPARYQPLYLLNPVAVCLESARRLTFPAAGHMHPLWPYLGIAGVVSTILFVVGFAVFKRCEPYYAESI